MSFFRDKVVSLFQTEDVEAKRKVLENEELDKYALAVRDQIWFSEISQLKKSVKGCVLTAATDREEYNENRRGIWNLDVRGFPWIIFCVDPESIADDVIQALAFGK